MKNYKVNIEALYSHYGTIEVEANTEEEAVKVAQNLFDEGDSDSTREAIWPDLTEENLHFFEVSAVDAEEVKP